MTTGRRATRTPTGRGWPVLSWVPGYERGWLPVDLIAGLTVCAILVPEGMAYAQLAGVPPEYAFYAAPAALLGYAVFGGSRQLVVAVSSAVAIMSAATISGIAVPNTPEYIALTAALAILAGLLSIAAGLLRLGRIAQFFSDSVLIGFVFGLALLITIKQIPKILGIEAHGDTALLLIRDMIPKLKETDLLTLAVGVGCIVAMVVLEKALPRIPAALVVLIGAIGVSVAFGLEAHGVAVVGPLPAGLAGPTLPGVGLELDPAAASRGPSGSCLSRSPRRSDPRTSLRASTAGRSIRTGSSSRSACRTRGRALLGVPDRLVALEVGGERPGRREDAPVARHRGRRDGTRGPVSHAAFRAAARGDARGDRHRGGLLDDEGREDARALAACRADFVFAMIALVGVLVMPTLPALAIAVIVSLVMLVWRVSEPRLTFLGRAVAGLEPTDLAEAPDAAIPGLMVVMPQEMLFFANVTSVRDEILRAVADAIPPTTVVLLDLAMTPEVDVPVVDAISDLDDRLAGAGCELWLCSLRPGTHDLLDRAGVLAAMGPARIHARGLDGIVAFVLSVPGDPEEIVVFKDVRDFIRERAAQPDVGPDGARVLAALDARLTRQLEAAGADAPVRADAPTDSAGDASR